MAGTTIPLLTEATLPLAGTELIIVEQGGVTKKSTINAGQQIALTAANTAQTTADGAATDATNALNTANTALSNAGTAQATANTALANASTAQTAANNAQSTANGKLSTVAVNGTTITGDGTVGNALAANIPTIYQEVTKLEFADLVTNHTLVAGASYLVTDAYISYVYARVFPILVTAISSTNISELSWVKYVYGYGLAQYDSFVKCRTDVSFTFLTFYEMTSFMYLNSTQCLLVAGSNEFAAGCIMFVYIGSKICQTSVSAVGGSIVTKNVMSLTDNGILGDIDINANTFTPYTASNYVGYKSYVAILNQSGTSAPVPTLMVDEISGATTPIYFDRTGAGQYRAIKFGAFTAGKTTKIIQNNSAFVTTILTQSGADAILIYTYAAGGSLTDSCLTDATFEIRVYN